MKIFYLYSKSFTDTILVTLRDNLLLHIDDKMETHAYDPGLVFLSDELNDLFS